MIKKVAYFIVLLLFLMLSNWELLAQNYNFKKYTMRDGLPSMYLYDMIQDKDGLIWLTTEGGICVFDGHHFQEAPTTDLINKEVVNMSYDKKGRIWFIDIENNFFFYEKGALYYPPFERFRQFGMGAEIAEDQKGNYWFRTTNHATGCVPYEHVLDSTAYTVILEEDGGGTFYAANATTNYIISSSRALIIEDKKVVDTIFLGPRYNNFSSTGILLPETEDLLFYSSQKLFSFSFETKELNVILEEEMASLEGNITYIYQDDQYHLWISTTDGVVVLFYDKKTKKYTKIKRFLDDILMGVVMQDQQKNYWLASHRDGLYFLSSLDVEVYQQAQFRRISALAKDHKNNIFIGTDAAWMSVLDTNFEKVYTGRFPPPHGYVYDILVNKKGKALYFTSKGEYSWCNNELGKETFLINRAVKAAHYTRDSSILIGTHAGCFINRDKKLHDARTYAVYSLDDDWFLIGSVQGLYEYKKGIIRLVDEKLSGYDIRDIAVTEDSTYYLASQKDGLIRYKDGAIQFFKQENNLVSNFCKKIAIDGSVIWLGTTKGVNKINLRDSSIYSITIDNGLPDNDINDLLVAGDKVVVATNNGVAYFDKNKDWMTLAPKIYFNAIKVARQDTSIQASYALAYDQNDIAIHFSSIAYLHTNDMKYQYQLEGLPHATWTSTQLSVASYPALPAGDYTFKVRAKTNNSAWSPIEEIRFYIAKPYWTEWWFYGLMVVLFGGITYTVVRYRLNNMKARNAIEVQIKESQLTALRAQMNPHFLFNALNSIQDFIIQQDRRSANLYLSKFSRLMRAILQASDQEHIPLEQETNAIELYLSLESMRFEKDFEYKLTIAPNLDQRKIRISPMLVQPYVENAIKHGLHHQDGKKILLISFYKKASYLVCEVEDNGVGREKSKEIKRRNQRIYPSKAMGLTEKRLNLLNATSTKKNSIEVIDLVNEHADAVGTKIVLYISFVLDEN